MLTIEEFKAYKQQLAAIIASFSQKIANLSSEEKLAFQKASIAKYVKVEEELFSYDLSSIPFNLYEGISLLAPDGKVLDLSKSNANIDFKMVEVYGNVNFKGCNLKNITSSKGKVSPEYLDEEVVRTHKDYFLSKKIPKEFQDKWYQDDITLADLVNLAPDSLEELETNKDLYSHIVGEGTPIKVLGLKNVVNLYRNFPSDYEDIKKLLNLIKVPAAIKKINTIDSSPQKLISNIYQVVREELLYPTNMYNPISLSITTKTQFPEKFILANEDIFKMKIEMEESLRTRYYERKLTTLDIIDNYSLFKDLPLSSFAKPESLVVKLNNFFGKYAFQEIYKAYPHVIRHLSGEDFNVNLRLTASKEPVAGFKEAMSIYLRNKSFSPETKVPEWLTEMFTKVVDSLHSFTDLKNLDDKTCLLDYYQNHLINQVGLNNLFLLEKETGIFTHQEDNHRPFEFFEAFSSYLKNNWEEKTIPKMTYPEFREFLAKCLNEMRKYNYFTDYADYSFINGSFRKDFKDIFIKETCPQELIKAFYHNKINFSYVRTHPQYISYLLDMDLGNLFPDDFILQNLNMSFCTYYTNSFGRKALLDLMKAYGEYLPKTINYQPFTMSTSKNDADRIIRNYIYYEILTGKNYYSYAYLSQDKTFFLEHPDIFLSPEELPFLYDNTKESIIKAFYAGKLEYNDIFLNPEISKVLEHKNLYVAFRKKNYNFSGKPEEQIYLDKLGTKDFLRLCTTYGKFLSQTIGLLPKDALTSYDTLTKSLESIILDEVKNQGYKFEPEEAPIFLKKQHPELFLSNEAPEHLKIYFYGGLDFAILSVYAKDWLPFLEGKDILSSLIRSQEYPKESLIEYFHNFGREKALLLGIKKTKTVSKMLKDRQVLVMKNWYAKTGQTFIPDYVVMQNFPEREIDKFLTAGVKWSKLMKISEFAQEAEGREAMLKIAYSFGAFDNDTRGFKECIDLLTKLPTKINKDIGYALERLDMAIAGKIDSNTFFQRGDIPSLYQAINAEDTPLDKDHIFQSLYRKSEDNTYVLTIDQQKYPKSIALLKETLGKFPELNIMSSKLAHQLFGGFKLEYDPDFREFFLTNLESIFQDDENKKYLASVQKQFKEIKVINSNRHLTWDLALNFAKKYSYENVEVGNEEMASVASLAGYSEQDFNILQQIYNYGKQRTKSSIPRVEGDNTKYHYEILRLDDPLALAIGTLTDCCQEIDNAAEVCMEHSMTSPDGRIFVIKDHLGNIVAQSWVWRRGNTLCFDNIEIPDKAFQRAEIPREEFTDEVYQIYKMASKELIKKDEEVYQKMLANKEITLEEYNSLKLSKVTVGLGYNDIASSIKNNAILDTGRIAKPLDYIPPIKLKRGLYTNDSITQYILEGKISKDEISKEALPVHNDEYQVYDNTTFTKDILYHLERLELLTKQDKNHLLTQLTSYEESDLMTSLARHYNLNPSTIRVILNANIAIIYDYDDTTIRLGDILYNKNIGLNKEIDITDVICLQVYLALKQIAKTRIIDSSRLSKEQLEIYNTSMNIKEIGGSKYGR